ncbi:MAG TPA: NlpC/P60 family protein [Chthoniobacterales bacterium]|nr:NlpC/P60 family protein [Chthoniobacterales bacterium]
MKSKLRFLIVMALAIAMSIASASSQEQKETLGDKLKRFFAHPSATPTPTPRRSHKRSSPSPSPSSNEAPTPSDGNATIPSYGETPLPKPEPSASLESLAPVEARTPETQYFEPVRPINPGPRRSESRTIYPPPQTIPSPSETPSPIPEISDEANSEERPTPSLPPVTGAASQVSIPSEAEILESRDYSEDVRKLIQLSLALAKKNLNYKYASADPANGGLDCSGFIYYVFTKSGVKNVPRDAREQYVWVRKAGNFQAVLGHGDDTFEIDALKPGDLLFWANNSGMSREPEIAQIMIYLGHDKATNQRLMVGASEGSTYQGEKRSGVGVFDFKLGAAEQNTDEEPTSVFVGYGRFPDLSGN